MLQTRFQMYFLLKKCIVIQILFCFVPDGPTDNKSRSDPLMARHQIGYKPILHQYWLGSLTHIFGTRSQCIEQRTNALQPCWILLLYLNKCLQNLEWHLLGCSSPISWHIIGKYIHTCKRLRSEKPNQFSSDCILNIAVNFISELLKPK